MADLSQRGIDWWKTRIKAKVRLRWLVERNLPIQFGRFGCPSKIEHFPQGCMYDVLIRVTQDRVHQGELMETYITFLHPEIAEKYLRVGAKIVLWELKDVAEGEIIELLY